MMPRIYLKLLVDTMQSFKKSKDTINSFYESPTSMTSFNMANINGLDFSKYKTIYWGKIH